MNDQTRMSVTETMAQRFGMTPNNFEQVLRATVLPKECTREQFAAFLLIARKYNLDPIARELYAFPRPGGGIQPIVSIDGWMEIINSHPQMDGMEFEDIVSEDGTLLAIKCRIHRKDRAHSTEVIEYMAECRRSTDTWRQWPARMLRHKAAIQCARYAFGFSGIIDPDEYERASDNRLTDRSRTGKKEMARQFKAWEPTGEPETWEEKKTGEPLAVEQKPVSAADHYEQGRDDRDHGVMRKAPADLISDPVAVEAWIAGWDSRNEELLGSEAS